jgi:hypothetical protein
MVKGTKVKPEVKKGVRFDSLPPIKTLVSPSCSPPQPNNDFPALQDSGEKPFTYAAATRRRRNRGKTPELTTATTTPSGKLHSGFCVFSRLSDFH